MNKFDDHNDGYVVTLLLTLLFQRRSPGTKNMIVDGYNYNDIPALVERIQRIDRIKMQTLKNAVINTAAETMYQLCFN